jgi:serine/threonine-protein kinase RsbW
MSNDGPSSRPGSGQRAGTADEQVELALPAQVEHLRLARLTASGFASDLDFSIDDVEDLRLAVDEAAALLVEHAPVAGSRLTLTYRVDDGTVVIEGRCPINGRSLEVDPIRHAVLSTTVDSFEVSSDGKSASFRLRRRAGARG